MRSSKEIIALIKALRTEKGISLSELASIVVRLYPKEGNKKTPTDQMGVVSCYVISFCGDTPEHQ